MACFASPLLESVSKESRRKYVCHIQDTAQRRSRFGSLTKKRPRLCILWNCLVNCPIRYCVPSTERTNTGFIRSLAILRDMRGKKINRGQSINLTKKHGADSSTRLLRDTFLAMHSVCICGHSGRASTDERGRRRERIKRNGDNFRRRNACIED